MVIKVLLMSVNEYYIHNDWVDYYLVINYQPLWL